MKHQDKLLAKLISFSYTTFTWVLAFSLHWTGYDLPCSYNPGSGVAKLIITHTSGITSKFTCKILLGKLLANFTLVCDNWKCQPFASVLCLIFSVPEVSKWRPELWEKSQLQTKPQLLCLEKVLCHFPSNIASLASATGRLWAPPQRLWQHWRGDAPSAPVI